MEAAQKVPTSPDELLTLDEAVSLVKVSKRKLQGDMAAGALAYVKLGRSVRFLQADLHAYIQARRVQCRRSL